MEVKQVINGGKLTSSYMSTWNSELQLTVEGGHEITVKVEEGVLRDLVSRLKERVETIDNEREEERQAAIDSAVEAATEAVETEAGYEED